MNVAYLCKVCYHICTVWFWEVKNKQVQWLEELAACFIWTASLWCNFIPVKRTMSAERGDGQMIVMLAVLVEVDLGQGKFTDVNKII